MNIIYCGYDSVTIILVLFLLHFHIIRDEIKFWVTHVKVMGRAVSTFLLTHSNHNSDALAKYCIHTHTHANVHTTHYHISTSFFKRAREIILFTNITTAQFRFSKHKMSVTAYPLTYLKISCFHTFFSIYISCLYTYSFLIYWYSYIWIMPIEDVKTKNE